jgi:hypothetical protein
MVIKKSKTLKACGLDRQLATPSGKTINKTMNFELSINLFVGYLAILRIWDGIQE